MTRRFSSQLTVRREFWLRLVVYIVGLHGLFVIAMTLVEQLGPRLNLHLSALDIDIDVPLLIGLGLVYLSTLLRRRKQTAWFVAILVYIFMLGFYANQTAVAIGHHTILQIIAKFGLPLLNIVLLLLYRRRFTVRSDIRSFKYALRFIVLILLTAFMYGTAGFMLMDRHDFHHNISLGEAMHRTVDQFGLTTSSNLVPQTRRAQLFVDSLSVVSVAALSYAAISLFQPIRSRYTDHRNDRQVAQQLLDEYGGNSEDFFKLWPHDKQYFFDKTLVGGVAYKVQRGIALVVGDPLGSHDAAKRTLHQFEDLCYGNDWEPVFVHTTPEWTDFYKTRGYQVQKIGEEAILDIAQFQERSRGNRYFRQIANKFIRRGMTTELLLPPHDTTLLQRLRVVSDEWLTKPGRVERGLMLGYFSEEYLQQCPILVVRDSVGIIQAFLNQVPSYDPQEANFDLLRHANKSLGNINDFLLMAFIEHLHAQEGIRRLNLGLCPLSGMDDLEEKSVISRALHFLYDNGDRFYSFSGLRRFKAKYEPTWSDRYLVYKGGVRSLAKITNALRLAARVKLK